MKPAAPASTTPPAEPPRPMRATLLWRFTLGAVLGLFLHYLLYRISLPIEPFIYVAF
jgi:hypothetical protein